MIKENHTGKNPQVLITGAGAGIGREMARLFHKKGFDVLAVSLLEDELLSLKEELDTLPTRKETRILATDLCEPEAAMKVFHWSGGHETEIDVLINNAGFGLMGELTELPYERLVEMMQLNMLAVTSLCSLFGRVMKKRSHGWILNVSSTISFQPLPFFAVYSATKAFVSTFTMALAEEMAPGGVIVSCLYPGTTKTAFLEKAGVSSQNKAYRLGSLIHSIAMKPEKTAQYAFNGLKKGKRRIIPGISNKLHFCFIHIIPVRLITFSVRLILKKRTDI